MSDQRRPVWLALLPWRLRRRYWRRHQCPAWDSVSGLCCTRRRHAGFDHRDGRGDRL